MTLSYNDPAGVEQAFADAGQDIACVIVEPVAGNMNCIPPQPGFLEALRAACDQHGSVLIFDEVMTGFRFGLAGAQGFYGVQPDLTTLGKVIGGGMPVGAFGGRREIMEQIAPLGPVYQAGTLSGNPVAMAAGLATLDIVAEPGFYEPLFTYTAELCDGMEAAAREAGVPFTTNHAGTMFGGFFTERETVTSYHDVMACDTERFSRFFHAMLDNGVYLAPASYEAGFVSSAHGNTELDATLEAARKAFATL